MIVEDGNGSVEEVAVTAEDAKKFCLSDDQAICLAAVAMKVCIRHFCS